MDERVVTVEAVYGMSLFNSSAPFVLIPAELTYERGFFNSSDPLFCAAVLRMAKDKT